MRRTDSLLRSLLVAAPLAAFLAGAALAQGGAPAQNFGGLKLSGDKPIQIESDKLQVNQNANTALFTGNVNVTQGDTLLKSGQMLVHYSKGANAATASESNIESIDVSGKVYIKSNDEVATGDSGTFDMKSQVLTLKGKQVVLTQGPNVVVGCELVANMKTGQSVLHGCGGGPSKPGRVKVLLTPKKSATE